MFLKENQTGRTPSQLQILNHNTPKGVVSSWGTLTLAKESCDPTSTRPKGEFPPPLSGIQSPASGSALPQRRSRPPGSLRPGQLCSLKLPMVILQPKGILINPCLGDFFDMAVMFKSRNHLDMMSSQESPEKIQTNMKAIPQHDGFVFALSCLNSSTCSSCITSFKQRAPFALGIWIATPPSYLGFPCDTLRLPKGIPGDAWSVNI